METIEFKVQEFKNMTLNPDDAVAELDALVVAQGAAELAEDGLRDSETAGEALVVAPDPVTGVTRRRPA